VPVLDLFVTVYDTAGDSGVMVTDGCLTICRTTSLLLAGPVSFNCGSYMLSSGRRHWTQLSRLSSHHASTTVNSYIPWCDCSAPKRTRLNGHAGGNATTIRHHSRAGRTSLAAVTTTREQRRTGIFCIRYLLRCVRLSTSSPIADPPGLQSANVGGSFDMKSCGEYCHVHARNCGLATDRNFADPRPVWSRASRSSRHTSHGNRSSPR